MSIPKTIHYCWFGHGERTELMNNCILSWRNILSEYEIVEWNEENFDVQICQYADEAYKAQKYAFVSDFARFHILYHHGGIYMDIDVEAVAALDSFLNHEAFMGFESGRNVNPGLITGAQAGCTAIKEMLDGYYKRRFISDYGSFNMTTVVKYTTDWLTKQGLKPNDKYQVVAGVAIYPRTYFCPLSYNGKGECFSESTHTIHHFLGSWLTEAQKKRNKSITWKITGPVLGLVKQSMVSVLGEKGFNKLKLFIKRCG